MKRILWKLKERELQLGNRTLLMGVLNVAPDSFSDGGKFTDPDRAFAHAIEMEEQGADIIDVGAESTHPGSSRITEAEEWQRLAPVLKRLRGRLAAPVSVDTYKAAVAEKALDLGVEIINDPSGLTFDPHLAKIVAERNAALILNHMRGTPETWAKLPPLPHPMASVVNDLQATINRALRAGLTRAQLALDPGLGFGKRKEQNFEILARLGELVRLDLPVLVGPSRKSFLNQTTPPALEFAGAAAVTVAVLNGAHMVRVHDVAAIKPVLYVVDEIVRTRDQGL